MTFCVKDLVEHATFGIGTIEDILGEIVRVNFFGELIDINKGEIKLKSRYESDVKEELEKEAPDRERVEYRRASEAINLGIVPPDQKQLIDLTIGAEEIKLEVTNWLDKAGKEGLCKVLFGYYGTGKTHLLQVIKCLALQAGWVVSYLEFDPKEADPAKPHLVYRNLMSTLEFPEREDGTKAEGFFGFVKEVRDNWRPKSLRDLIFFRASPWFSRAFEVLIRYPHSDDQDYQSACNWLAGDYKSYDKINLLGRNRGYRYKVPRMPVIKETGDIYVFHLVVINELCQALGYKGLIVILDEAEHVRGYNVRRRERANNFFDILSRCAHPPINDIPPYLNEHGIDLPQYWLKGPHFGLFVGLTEGDTFSDPNLPLREACVFLHKREDMIFLKPPSPEDYRAWCVKFTHNFYRHYPLLTIPLKNERDRQELADALCEMLRKIEPSGVILRNWIKLAALVPCIILSKNASDIETIIEIVKKVASQYIGLMPWEA